MASSRAVLYMIPEMLSGIWTLICTSYLLRGNRAPQPLDAIALQYVRQHAYHTTTPNCLPNCCSCAGGQPIYVARTRTSTSGLPVKKAAIGCFARATRPCHSKYHPPWANAERSTENASGCALDCHTTHLSTRLCAVAHARPRVSIRPGVGLIRHAARLCCFARSRKFGSRSRSHVLQSIWPCVPTELCSLRDFSNHRCALHGTWHSVRRTPGGAFQI